MIGFKVQTNAQQFPTKFLLNVLSVEIFRFLQARKGKSKLSLGCPPHMPSALCGPTTPLTAQLLLKSDSENIVAVWHLSPSYLLWVEMHPHP